jgi:hypothetical protein
MYRIVGNITEQFINYSICVNSKYLAVVLLFNNFIFIERTLFRLYM